jgi:3-oxoacyl-[acyl-carrier-protein] synthase-1
MRPVAITASTLVTALGTGNAETLAALRAQRSGLAPARFLDVELPTWIGVVPGLDGAPLPARWNEHDCRNSRLAWVGLQADGFVDAVAAARSRHGADRVGVLLGTSTAGLLETELGYRRRGPAGELPEDIRYAERQNTFSVGEFVRRALALGGPTFVVSTACSSSAKVYASAARLLAAGLIDAAVVGGVDSLCLTTLYGFNSLELLSPDICRPWDVHRRGLSIGEGAAFALLERDPVAPPLGWLLGTGESNDGYHMSAPHPAGAGAVAAMCAALDEAGLAPDDIGYVNLHGTATPSNDVAEDAAVRAVLGTGVPCSSTKGATGHALGAAGGVEAAICLLALAHGFIPGGLNVLEPDPALSLPYVRANRDARLRAVLSNSFGFGGSNASLVLGATR